MREGPGVGAAHFEEALEPHLRKERGQMVGPVVDGGLLARQRVEPPCEKIPERSAGDVDIAVVAVDEVHGHVERVVHVTLKAHAVLEGERQHAGAVGIGVAPNFRAIGLKPIGLAFGEGRVGEERGGHRLEREPDAELLHHVRLAAEIHVHLNRRGAEHHVEAVAPAGRHVPHHDAVALLGHERQLLKRPFRAEAEPEKADAKRARDAAHLGEMLTQLLLGLVDGLERRAGEFELAARLEADGAADGAVRAGERDDVAVLEHGLPAIAIVVGLEQRADAVIALVRDRGVVLDVEAELFVLGADAPIRFRLRSRLEISDELVARLDDGALRPTHLCRHRRNSAWIEGNVAWALRSRGKGELYIARGARPGKGHREVITQC